MRQIMKELVVTIDEDLDVRRINIILFFSFFFPFLSRRFLTLDISLSNATWHYLFKNNDFSSA